MTGTGRHLGADRKLHHSGQNRKNCPDPIRARISEDFPDETNIRDSPESCTGGLFIWKSEEHHYLFPFAGQHRELLTKSEHGVLVPLPLVAHLYISCAQVVPALTFVRKVRPYFSDRGRDIRLFLIVSPPLLQYSILKRSRHIIYRVEGRHFPTAPLTPATPELLSGSGRCLLLPVWIFPLSPVNFERCGEVTDNKHCKGASLPDLCPN
jgi:hypothetical protein